MTLLCFFNKYMQMLNLPDLLKENSTLLDLLKAFQPTEISECLFQGIQLIPSPGSIDYLYSGAYFFLESVFDVGKFYSFTRLFNFKPKHRKTN